MLNSFGKATRHAWDMASFFKLTILTLLISTVSFSNARPLSFFSSTATLNPQLSSIRSVCRTTPNPDVCFDSLKLSISIGIGLNPDILTLLLQTLENAISEAGKLTALLSGSLDIVETQKGTLQDCQELHQITVTSLQRAESRVQSSDPGALSDANAYLSAALTNKNTCLEGLDSATGSSKPTLVDSIISSYTHVANSLSMLSGSRKSILGRKNRRRLMGFPTWITHNNHRILEELGDVYDPSEILVVAKDGTGDFTTIGDAVSFAPSHSDDRVVIYIKGGVYRENVVIPHSKTNLVLLGAGAHATVITGSRSVADGWTTFRSATVAVSGEGFLARDITFENTAGPGKHQAVALLVNSDLSAIYHCTINGYQDTLYAHSFRQFYRECDISGTVDYIFGNAAAVFQDCNIVSRLPMRGQFNTITAQSRDMPEEETGFSMQRCSVVASGELQSNNVGVRSYLGRPWREYSRTVFLASYINGFIDPAGWKEWAGDAGLDTLYYGEYGNSGPGSATDNRVNWAGYHVMGYDDASNFKVAEFITGDKWLQSTAFPFDEGI